MRRAIGLSVIVLLVGVSFLSCVSGPNPTEVMGPKVADEWALERFDVKGKNVIGKTFDSGKIMLDLKTKRATITLELARSTIDGKLAEWKSQYPDLVIDSHQIISTAEWELDKKAETIFFRPIESNIEIMGSGDNFMGFYRWENSKFGLAKSAKEGSSGLLDNLVGAIATSATKTEDYFIQPDFAIGYWIEGLSESGYSLNKKKGGYMKLTR